MRLICNFYSHFFFFLINGWMKEVFFSYFTSFDDPFFSSSVGNSFGPAARSFWWVFSIASPLISIWCPYTSYGLGLSVRYSSGDLNLRLRKKRWNRTNKLFTEWALKQMYYTVQFSVGIWLPVSSNVKLCYRMRP